MSNLILYTVIKDGTVLATHEFRNSWGGAALIWDYFIEKYFPLKPEQKMWERKVGICADMKPIWDLVKRSDLPEAECVVLMSTFDNVMVKREDLNHLADCFEAVLKDMPKYIPNLSERVNHIQAEANVFRQIAEDTNILAVCWQQTTVAKDMWYSDEDLTEDLEGKSYNINIGNKHWFLFEEMKNDKKEQIKKE